MKGAARYLFLFFILFSCAPLYFHPIPQPGVPVRYGLSALPFRELWSGLVFNGEKVGFTHLEIEPLPGGLFRILGEASLSFNLLGIGQDLWMRSEDIVRPDLTLVSFRYEQRLGESRLSMEGWIKNGLFKAVRLDRAEKTMERRLTEPLYPSAVINLFPVVHGLTVGAAYRYEVFDPQVQDFAEVFQEVESFQESPFLGVKPSFKVRTRLHHHEVETWINNNGETVFELGLAGVLITHKEPKEKAQAYLAEATLGGKDVLLDFINVETPLVCPRQATLLEMELAGISGRLPLLEGPGQKADLERGAASPVVRYRIESPPAAYGGKGRVPEDLGRYLRPSYHIESNHPRMIRQAREIVGDEQGARKRITRLARWVSEEVKDDLVESFSALEVLERRRGECQAHAMLYAALARALGIPTKVIAGLLYVEGKGFLYHAWAESLAGDEWVSVDPSLNQVGVDATHVKLVEGDSWLSLLEIGKVVGRIKAEVLQYLSSCPGQ